MARKRLNKKIVLIGSVIFVLVVLVGIVVILRLSRDPQKFIKDGDAALLVKDYKKAERNYLRARAWAETDALRVEVLFKLVDVYLKTDKWNNILGCWNEIIRIDPKNMKARFARLKYAYIIADSGVRQAWQEVASQASEFLELADEDMLAARPAEGESFEQANETEQDARLYQLTTLEYLHLLRGRATLEITRMGTVTDKDESLGRAIEDLEKVRQLEPNCVDTYLNLAEAVVLKGDIAASKGELEERAKAADSALELLEQAVEIAGSGDARPAIDLLRMKFTLAQSGGREQIQLLEPKYLSLVEKFASSPDAYSTLAGFYFRLGPKSLDKAIDAAQKAVELDPGSIIHARAAANLHYHKFSIYGDQSEFSKAVEMARSALELPDAQDKPGPQNWANRNKRLSLCNFLANWHIEQVLNAGTVSVQEREKWLAEAERAVHEIEQIIGSGEAPRVVKWRGILELAKGQDRNAAIKKMYFAYEQLKSMNDTDSLLAYRLAKLFENTTELGAAREFFESALSLHDRAGSDRIDISKPEALLDYADVMLKLRAYGWVVSVVNFFENEYWPNEKSRMLRINAYIGANQFDQAQEALSHMQPDDPNAVKLSLSLVRAKIEQVQRAIADRQRKEGMDTVLQQWEQEQPEVADTNRDKTPSATMAEDTQLMEAELKGYRSEQAGLLEKLLEVEPNSVEEGFVIAVCNGCMAEGDNARASSIVNRCLEYFPDNLTLQFYKKRLSEPDPAAISQERAKQLEQEVRLSIAEPDARAVSLGMFYLRNNEPNKATVEFKKVLAPSLRDINDVTAQAQGPKAADEEITDSEYSDLAAGYLFDAAIQSRDWELASKMVALAQRKDSDRCGGRYFAARLALAKADYKDAMAKLNECLELNPVFSHAYILRSSVNAALGNEHQAIEDARKAATLNPLDGNMARLLANALYQRNRRIGDKAASDQIIETRDAVDRAMALNPGDLQLLSFYAEYISPTEPLRALAIRQSLQKASPSIDNAVMLGSLATKIALEETDAQHRDALFAIAASAFEQAQRINPHDSRMLYSYAEYYRARGQEAEAKQLLQASEDRRLLWNHYFQSGQFDDAKQVLDQLYQSQPNDVNALKGLLLVAERTADEEALKKYSEELLSLEDNVDNHLFQIQSFLGAGLVKESEYKLQSFKEKYPAEPRSLLLEAWLAMKQGRLEDAMELTNRALETDRDSSNAWRLRGDINRFMANYEQAILDLKRSKALSDNPETRIALSRAYLGTDRAEDAITELKNVIELPQAPLEAWILLEQTYRRLGRTETLMSFYRDTFQKFPDNPFWYIQAGAFAVTAGDLKSAEQLYSIALQKGKDQGREEAIALEGYLYALMAGGKQDKVFAEAGKYVDGVLAPIAFFRMGEAKLSLNDKDGAVEYCRKAVDRAGTLDESLAADMLQKMYALLGDKEVRRYCEEKLQANPDSAAANFTMFNLTRISGEYNKAVSYIDKCLEIMGPNSTHKVQYTMKKAEVLQLAYIRTSDKNYLERTVKEYESLLAEMPSNTAVLNNLAYLLAENNQRLDKALEYARRAYEAQPNNAGFLDTYAYVLYKNGRFLEASEFLQTALQRYEQDKVSVPTDVYEHLGMIKEGLGAATEALAAYKQALETATDALPEAVEQRIKTAIERLSSQNQGNESP